MSLAANPEYGRGRRLQVAGGCVSARERVNEGWERVVGGREEMGKSEGTKRPRAVDTWAKGGPKGRKDRPTQYFLPAPRCMLPGQTLCRLWYLSGKFSPQAHLSSRRGELSRRASQPRGESVTARG